MHKRRYGVVKYFPEVSRGEEATIQDLNGGPLGPVLLVCGTDFVKVSQVHSGPTPRLENPAGIWSRENVHYLK